jgi:protein-L-isoaspartate(D-aspartate) O-methyltransferase
VGESISGRTFPFLTIVYNVSAFEETLVHQGQRRKLALELQGKGIASQQVLEAITAVPRHWFFPKDFQSFAYRDAAFPIDHGQTISQPLTVAQQTQLLALAPKSKVLEVGTGSGYQAAVLLEMGFEVYTIEYIRPLLEQSMHVLGQIKGQIRAFHGDGSKGLAKYAPYDGILVTAGAPVLPHDLIAQLSVGGMLVIPVGDHPQNLTMMRYTKLANGEIREESFGPAKFVPLKGEFGFEP